MRGGADNEPAVSYLFGGGQGVSVSWPGLLRPLQAPGMVVVWSC